MNCSNTTHLTIYSIFFRLHWQIVRKLELGQLIEYPSSDLSSYPILFIRLQIVCQLIQLFEEISSHPVLFISLQAVREL